MRSAIYSISLVLVFVLFGCGSVKEKTVEDLLDNEEMAANIYSAIIADSLHLKAFMDKMMSIGNCRRMMLENQSMARMFCMSDKMDSILKKDQALMDLMTDRFIKNIEKDSMACDKTCTRMMQNEKLSKYLKSRLKNE
jgi:hypothetical protein